METFKLFAPKEYSDQPCSFFEASEELRSDVAGGCGPGGPGDMLVPDTMYGLSVRPACRIHDWMYHFGRILPDKELSDRVFLNNMVRIIKARGSLGFLENLRLRRAKTYYVMVRDFGGPAFWNSKNDETEMGDV